MSKAKRKNSSYKNESKKPVINSRSDRIRYANQKLYDYPLSVHIQDRDNGTAGCYVGLLGYSMRCVGICVIQ